MCLKVVKRDTINFNHVTTEDKNYIAGFLDGDGSILTQLVKGSNYKYNFTIRVSIVFYQKTKKYWFLVKLRKILGIGELRQKDDGTSDLTITGFRPVKNFLVAFLPYIRLKNRLAKLVLEILDKREKVQSQADFLEVCKLIDETATLTDSKTRKYTFTSVKAYLKE